jgi:hypothetical protein
MNYQRISVMFLICASFVLASSTSYAGEFNRQLMPRHYFKNHKPDLNRNSPRLKGAREQALAESKGAVTPLVKSPSGWTAKYNLYVNCNGKPLDETYPSIQEAVAAALPYTVINVCPGTYQAGGPATGIDVETSFVEIKGVSAHSGAETLVCDDTPNPDDDSWGIYLGGEYDSVVNMTINGCEWGVPIDGTTDDSVVSNDEVWNSWFNDDYYGVSIDYCDGCQVRDSKFSSNFFPIWTYGDVKDDLSGNNIEGDGTGDDDGIVVEYSVSARIECNTVSASWAGLDFGYPGDIVPETTADVVEEDSGSNDLAYVKGNHFNGNEFGVLIFCDNSGNKFEDNYANGNIYVGFYTEDDTNGVNAVPDSGPDQFLSNHAFGNGVWDYFDDTYGYTGPDTATNDGTADFYKNNKGNYADPASIL